MSVKDLNLEFNNEINVEIQPQASFRGHTNSVEVVAINPADSNMAITASHDHQIGVWDLNKKQAVKIMNAHRYIFPIKDIAKEFGVFNSVTMANTMQHAALTLLSKYGQQRTTNVKKSSKLIPIVFIGVHSIELAIS